MSFGYGTGICPSCYDNEENFLFLDKEYWLNRILIRLYKKEYEKQHDEYDEILLHDMMVEHEIHPTY
jgi:hypothetical protein